VPSLFRQHRKRSGSQRGSGVAQRGHGSAAARLRAPTAADDKGRAQQVPVKITFPLILSLFPALLIIVVGHGIIEIAHNLFHNL
jgi:hypothetical protein